MDKRLSQLWPYPQSIVRDGHGFRLPKALQIILESASDEPVSYVKRLEYTLTVMGVSPRVTATGNGNQQPAIRLRVDESVLDQPQGYILTVSEHGITVTGVDSAGLFYGVCTLVQLLALFAGSSTTLTLPGLRIEDWPDFPNRGVMLDVSRDKIPTMETLYALVERLASWKVNQLQLYMEHTFAYEGHEIVWQDASPFTPDEIRALDAFCQERYIELVPNQNSFGHMHRWLMHKPYRPLAECPQGSGIDFLQDHEPFTLCPIDHGSLELLADLYRQLLPNFSSQQFNVGLDETFDLGHGRSADACAEQSKECVYLDFLKKVHGLVTSHGRRMQFWGDIILHRPDLIPELPKDVIALEWGYEADHPFAEHCRHFSEAGLDYYVCPGTSSWNSIVGRTENALRNLQNAAVNGNAMGAIGFLNTDWGDNGHWQPLPVSYLGFLAGAGVSWNAERDLSESDIPALLDRYAFEDDAQVMGQMAYDLGNAYAQVQARPSNNSALFALLAYPERPLSSPTFKELTIEDLEATLAYIKRTVAALFKAEMARPDASLIIEEYRWATDMLQLACRFGIARLRAGGEGLIRNIPAQDRGEFAEELATLIERHRAVWLPRNRPGGLEDSAGHMNYMLGVLV